MNVTAPATRASDLLNFIDVLFHIDDSMIDLESKFMNKWRAIAYTYGDDEGEQLLPHVITLKTKLNELCQENVEVSSEVNRLKNCLSPGKLKCAVNSNFKGKTLECLEIEDQYVLEMNGLNSN